jgi:hypothetical protein
VQRLRFSATKYPNIKAHVQEAIAPDASIVTGGEASRV